MKNKKITNQKTSGDLRNVSMLIVSDFCVCAFMSVYLVTTDTKISSSIICDHSFLHLIFCYTFLTL